MVLLSSNDLLQVIATHIAFVNLNSISFKHPLHGAGGPARGSCRVLQEKVKSVTALDLTEVQGEGEVLDAVIDHLLHLVWS